MGPLYDPLKEPSTMTQISTIGLDIAKSSFSLHGFDAEGRTVLKKELRRHQLLPFFAALAACRVGLEACASAHHWARELAKLGHEVKLIAPARVKAFLARQKNDAADAMAIARAVRDPEMRFVPVKTVETQSVLMLFKSRDLLVAQRTMIINALRGHFAEIGSVVAASAQHAKLLVRRVMQEDPSLPPVMRAALRSLVAAYATLEGEIAALNRSIAAVHKQDERAKRLAEVPGIGVLIATVLSASVSDARSFASGREFAAWLGLVPRQHSTGGKPRLGHISKMGNRDLRRLLVVGAIAALSRMKAVKTRTPMNQSPLAEWARRLLAKKPFRLVAVALANKMARTAWAIMARGTAYKQAGQA
jgi:transposase